MKKETKCFTKHCRNDIEIYYYKVGLCDKYWTKLCDKPTDEVKRILGVKK